MITRSSARGVSLIELLVAIAIVGLTVAVALPSLHRTSRNRELRAATAELRTIFREVRSRAVTRGRNAGVKFRQIGGVWHYGLVDDGDGDGILNEDIIAGVDRLYGPYREVFGSTGSVRIGLPGVALWDPERRETIDPGASPVRFGRSTICSFAPNGGATPGTIYLTDGARSATAVVVYGGSGKVRMRPLSTDRGVSR